MADAAARTMTIEEFFDWQSRQEDLYELVDGVPIKMLKMMTGTSVQHDRVVVNIIASLHRKLRGGPCRPTTDDIALRTGIRSLRRPDVTIECGRMVPDTYESSEPRMVVEVLSPSTMGIDRIRKLEEYKRVQSLASILLVDTRAPEAILYARDAGGTWTTSDIAGLTSEIALPALGIAVGFADIYEGLAFS